MTNPIISTTPSTPSIPAAADPLAGLRDWHLPAPVAWWPPAPGWWLVAGFILVAGALGWVRWQRRQRASAAARVALARLAVLRQEFEAGGDQRRFAAGVSQLLRRLALIRYPRERVAGLTGTAWLSFLDASGGGNAFSDGPGQMLGELQYRAPGSGADQWSTSAPAPDAAALAALATGWIRTHRETAP